MRERAGTHPPLHLGNQFGIRERVGAPLNLNPVGCVFSVIYPAATKASIGGLPWARANVMTCDASGVWRFFFHRVKAVSLIPERAAISFWTVVPDTRTT